jgi:hypothetical protein
MAVSPILISALDTGIRKSLADARDQYFVLLLASTVVVAIGIAMEGPEVFHDFMEEFEHFFHGRTRWEVDKRTGRPITPHRLNWKKLLESFGWLLIVMGVSGEFVLEGLVFVSDRQLQTFENTITGFAVARANEQAAAANERAAEAQRETARLTSENLKLKTLIQPRDLTLEQLGELTNRLRPFAGRDLSIRSFALDLEARRLGMLIASAVERAGLHVADNLGTVMNLRGRIIEGIEVRGPAHTQDDLINALLASPLGRDRQLNMVRNPTAGITGNFGDQVMGENPGLFSGVRAEIFIGVKPIRVLR